MRKTRTIPWREVTGFHVLPTLFGRSVVVSDSDGRRYSLAAPREGLLGRDPRFGEALEAMNALAPRPVEVKSISMWAVRITVWIVVTAIAAALVFVWRPWLEPWWPGRDEAGSLPRACAVVDRPAAEWLPPSPERTVFSLHEDGTSFVNSECAYRSGQGAGARGSVRLELDRVLRTTSTGATEKARADYAEAREAVAECVRARSGRDKDWTAVVGDVAGLGDQAWRSVALDRGTGETEVRIVIRRANVLVEIDHSAQRPKEQVVSAADALAREALRRLDGR
ncbi:hypothetical protein E1281_28225 [Actinomadura sp. KC345]|uniref:hypothetical protein n=1 Tax=Actinomadura sp. KC345 TaxID=2530371 RepID=UPI001047EA3C|nr:hypothetical protein [Actinomadura sp. KC345]TDC46320.1 hypothetical protein E1281_28225 [Actinomadura sp. KC345]